MHRRVALLLFAAGWGANQFSPLLLVYRRELALTPVDLGILFAAYAVGLVPGLLLAGRASDARGRRALVLPATGLCMTGSAVLAFGSHGFGVLLAGRLLYGLGMGCVMSPGSVWVQELSSAELGPRRATLAFSSGFGLGALVTGLLAELAPAPMVLPYVVHAALSAAALVLAQRVPETARRERTLLSSGAAVPAGLGRREVRLLAELLPAAPWTFGLAALALVTLPGLFRAQVSRPLVYAALASMVTLSAGVLVQPLTTRIGKRADLLGMLVGGCSASSSAPPRCHSTRRISPSSPSRSSARAMVSSSPPDCVRWPRRSRRGSEVAWSASTTC